jgi:DNA-binding phage protein
MTTKKKRKSNKTVSTYDKAMRDPKRKARIEKDKYKLIIQELILALMEGDDKSVRELAKMVGLSKTVVQGLRSSGGDPKISSFANILHALGAEIVVVKNGEELAHI